MVIVDLLLIPIWFLLLTVLHESGHAIAFRVLGFKIYWISFGRGRRLADKRFLGVRLKLNLGLPVAGTMGASPRSDWIRVRLWLAVIAGPATHLAVLLVIYFLAGPKLVLDGLESLVMETHPTALAILFCVNAAMLADSLLPYRIRYSKHSPPQPTDGYRLVTIPFLGKDGIARLRAQYHVREAVELIDSGHDQDGLRQCQEAVAIDPGNIVASALMALAHTRLGNWRGVREANIELLQSAKTLRPDFRDTLKNDIAWFDLLIGDPDLLPEADGYSAEALGAAPDKAHFQGTRGAVLVSLGHFDKGIELLKQAYSRHCEPHDSASVAFWLGIAEARLGNYREASQWVEAAREKWPGHELAERAQLELEAATIEQPAATD
jgi:hypothetical protein